jgi:uncharacterized protein YpmS
MKKDLPKVKKAKFWKYVWPAILIVLVVFVSAFILVAHRPRGYAPMRAAEPNQVSRYLTNELLPSIYNGGQAGKPFEVVITQEGLNDIVSHLPQPMRIHNVTLADPQVILTPMQITLMATVEARPVDFFLTVELNPFINKEGLLNLCVNRVMLGAVDITSIARSIGDKAYMSWMSLTGTEPNNPAAQVCRSLLWDEPFDPVFRISGRTLRVSKIDIMGTKIIALLAVVPEQAGQVSQTSRRPAETSPAISQ